jgi:hypothetical protein
MYEDSGLVFEHSFENDSTYSYLVLKLDNDVKLVNHQTEIICQNPSPAFVPFQIRRENENLNIYYNITSKISLAQYLNRKKLSKKELLDLLKNITKNLMLHANYLLDLSSFIIHLDYIYINPATAEVSLVYIPVSCERDTMEVYISFLKDLVVNSANVIDNASDNYLQRILNYLKSDVFNLSDFNRLIVDLRDFGELDEPISRSAKEYCEKPASYETESGCNSAIAINHKEKAKTGSGVDNKILNIVLLQLLIIIAAVLACLLMLSRSAGDTISIAGVLIIAAALDVLAMKRITGRKIRQTADDKKQETVSDNRHLEQKEVKRSADAYNTVQRRELIYGKSRYQTDSSVPDVLKANDTIMISEVPKVSHPYLESVGARNIERVIINKNKFVIGRLGSMVDYIVQGSTVGKLHAEISVNEGVYYIKDLNSKNGTYINGVRIPSNKECEIKRDDRIKFSNFEYVFTEQEVL